MTTHIFGSALFGCSAFDFRKTRTCIHTPGYPPLVPEELTKENLFAALDGAEIVYFDVRLPQTALVVAEEVIVSLILVSQICTFLVNFLVFSATLLRSIFVYGTIIQCRQAKEKFLF